MIVIIVSAGVGGLIAIGLFYLRIPRLIRAEAKRIAKRSGVELARPPFPNGVDFGGVAGNCPLQGWGTIDGKEFYFRARGSQWSFTVGGDEDPIYELVGDFGDWPDAGWMSQDIAHGLILASIAAYRSSSVAIQTQ